MKIISIITQMEGGGAQGAAVRNLKYFGSKGVDAEVWFLYLKRPVYKDVAGVKCLLDRSPESVFDYIYIVFKLWWMLLRDRNITTVLCYTHYANVIGGVVARLAFKKRVVVSHRNPVDTYPRLCRILDSIVGRLGFYSKAIAVSQTVYDSFSNYSASYTKNLIKIYNGVDLNYYQAPEVCNAKLNSKKILFITTGRLHPQKNQRVIFDAIAKVDGCELHVAGDGELREEYEQYIIENGLSNKIKLLGEIPPDKVKSFLLSGDVFLFPSNYEAFGFSVVEAMAAKLPVICSDIPAMREIVSNAGIIVNKDDVNGWASAMSLLAISNDKRIHLSKLSTERAQEFSLEKMASSYLEACKI